MTHKSGQQLFAAPDDEQAVIEAKKYITDNGYTSEQVKLVRRDGQVLVVAR